MPKNNSALLKKVSHLLKISIFLAKLKKPIIPKLISCLKKTRKMKKLKLLKQYNYYSYVKEYEFSPSSTPLIEFQPKSRDGEISFKKLYSKAFFISRRLGIESSLGREFTTIELSNSSSEDESVDERAERFIRRFYEEMRRQRQESNFQLLEI